MPRAPVREMGMEELHGASLVQAIDTNQQDLPISHPDLLQAKSQHWLQLELGWGVVFSWADNALPVSTLQATWGRMGKAPRKSARHKADGFRYQLFL